MRVAGPSSAAENRFKLRTPFHHDLFIPPSLHHLRPRLHRSAIAHRIPSETTRCAAVPLYQSLLFAFGSTRPPSRCLRSRMTHTFPPVREPREPRRIPTPGPRKSNRWVAFFERPGFPGQSGIAMRCVRPKSLQLQQPPPRHRRSAPVSHDPATSKNQAPRRNVRTWPHQRSEPARISAG